MTGVPVTTRAGGRVGKVASFNLDQATGHLITLEVKASGFVAGLATSHLLIPWDAIVEMTDQRVVVQDGVIESRAVVAAGVKPAVNPTMMHEC